MNRHPFTLALLIPILGVIVGCGTTAPSPAGTAAVPSAPATPMVTTPAGPATSEAADVELELRGDGLGDFAFGALQVDVSELLNEQLGDPDETTSGVLCELDDSSPWAETVLYGGLWVQYEAKDRSKKSVRYLSAWGFTLDKEFGPPLTMVDDVPLTLTFAELKTTYPAGKMVAVGIGDAMLFTLPNQIQFLGSGKPDQVRAGAFNTCE